MYLTEKEWSQVKEWLNGYRVCCRNDSERTEHEKIKNFYNNLSKDVFNFLVSKELER